MTKSIFDPFSAAKQLLRTSRWWCSQYFQLAHWTSWYALQKSSFFPYVPLPCSSMEDNSVYHCYRCAWPLPPQDVLWVLLCVSALSMNIYAIPVPTSEHTTLFLLWCVLAWCEPGMSIWFLSVGLWRDGSLVGEAQVGLSLQCCCWWLLLQSVCPGGAAGQLPARCATTYAASQDKQCSDYSQVCSPKCIFTAICHTSTKNETWVTFLASKARPNHGLSNHPWLANELLEDGTLHIQNACTA